jgi:hypothetical protein
MTRKRDSDLPEWTDGLLDRGRFTTCWARCALPNLQTLPLRRGGPNSSYPRSVAGIYLKQNQARFSIKDVENDEEDGFPTKDFVNDSEDGICRE